MAKYVLKLFIASTLLLAACSGSTESEIGKPATESNNPAALDVTPPATLTE